MKLFLFFFFFLLAAPHGMWDLSSPTRDQTHAPAMEAQHLNHWTAREVPEWNHFWYISKKILTIAILYLFFFFWCGYLIILISMSKSTFLINKISGLEYLCVPSGRIVMTYFLGIKPWTMWGLRCSFKIPGKFIKNFFGVLML